MHQLLENRITSRIHKPKSLNLDWLNVSRQLMLSIARRWIENREKELVPEQISF